MVSIQEDFINFYEKVKISESKKTTLREKRNILREEIRTYFKDGLNQNYPKFHGQGSMSMGTTINPLDDGEYDIDDGIYLNNSDIECSDIGTWLTTEKAHEIVIEAIEKYNRTVENKNNCVRVTYAENFHIDMPIYLKDFDDDTFVPKIATLDNGWIDSDPKANTDYYLSVKNKYGQIVNRLVVYLKAMIDFQSIEYGQPSGTNGFELTLFVCREISQLDISKDDQEILEDLLNKIYETCNSNIALIKPVTKEDLWNKKTDEEKNCFLSIIRFSKQAISQVNNLEDKEKACCICADIFGKRFYTKPNIFILNLGSTAHRKTPPWQERLTSNVNITATIRTKKGPKSFSSNRTFRKNVYIYFRANIDNIQEPYEIEWQVTNTGKDAQVCNQLRGSFEKSNEDKFVRREHTKYKGTHIVQCFIIKDNLCVAKSQEFYVNII